jgi:peptide/nickel transport system ATP-binding protein
MPTDRKTILDVHDVRVGFRRTRRGPTFFALDGVSLTVDEGKTMGLIGESGSGKSTLANTVLGLTSLQSGTVTLRGEDITRLRGARRRTLGRILQAVFQDPNSSLNPSWTIGRSLAEPMRAQGVRSGTVIAERTAQMLEDVGLSQDAVNRIPGQFSGGQLQRVSIARALMTDPRLVICDESVSALDLSVQAQILNLLSELQRAHGVSYLFISHDMSVVRHVCHDITVLYRGQVMESGPTAAVTDNPAHPYTRTLLQAVPVADPDVQRRRREKATEPTDAVAATAGCPFASRCQFAREICRTERPPLRQLSDNRAVACHRYPEWHDEIPPHAEISTATQGDPAGTTTPETEVSRAA